MNDIKLYIKQNLSAAKANYINTHEDNKLYWKGIIEVLSNMQETYFDSESER